VSKLFKARAKEVDYSVVKAANCKIQFELVATASGFFKLVTPNSY